MILLEQKMITQMSPLSLVTKIKSRKQTPINPRDKANWKQKDGITFWEGLIVVNNKDLQLEIIQQTHNTPIGEQTSENPRINHQELLVVRTYNIYQ